MQMQNGFPASSPLPSSARGTKRRPSNTSTTASAVATAFGSKKSQKGRVVAPQAGKRQSSNNNNNNKNRVARRQGVSTSETASDVLVKQLSRNQPYRGGLVPFSSASDTSSPYKAPRLASGGGGGGSTSGDLNKRNASSLIRTTSPRRHQQCVPPALHASLLLGDSGDTSTLGSFTVGPAAAGGGGGPLSYGEDIDEVNMTYPQRPAGPVVTEEWARSLIRPEDEYLLYARNSAGVPSSGSGRPGSRVGKARQLEAESRRRQAGKLAEKQQQQQHAAAAEGAASRQFRQQHSSTQHYARAASANVDLGRSTRLQRSSMPLSNNQSYNTFSEGFAGGSMSAHMSLARGVLRRSRAASAATVMSEAPMTESRGRSQTLEQQQQQQQQRETLLARAPEVLSGREGCSPRSEVGLRRETDSIAIGYLIGDTTHYPTAATARSSIPSVVSANVRQLDQRNTQVFFRKPSYQLFEGGGGAAPFSNYYHHQRNATHHTASGNYYNNNNASGISGISLFGGSRRPSFTLGGPISRRTSIDMAVATTAADTAPPHDDHDIQQLPLQRRHSFGHRNSSILASSIISGEGLSPQPKQPQLQQQDLVGATSAHYSASRKRPDISVGGDHHQQYNNVADRHTVALSSLTAVDTLVDLPTSADAGLEGTARSGGGDNSHFTVGGATPTKWAMTQAQAESVLMQEGPEFYIISEENHQRLELRNDEFMARQFLRRFYDAKGATFRTREEPGDGLHFTDAFSGGGDGGIAGDFFLAAPVDTTAAPGGGSIGADAGVSLVGSHSVDFSDFVRRIEDSPSINLPSSGHVGSAPALASVRGTPTRGESAAAALTFEDDGAYEHSQRPPRPVARPIKLKNFKKLLSATAAVVAVSPKNGSSGARAHSKGRVSSRTAAEGKASTTTPTQGKRQTTNSSGSGKMQRASSANSLRGAPLSERSITTAAAEKKSPFPSSTTTAMVTPLSQSLVVPLQGGKAFMNTLQELDVAIIASRPTWPEQTPKQAGMTSPSPMAPALSSPEYTAPSASASAGGAMSASSRSQPRCPPLNVKETLFAANSIGGSGAAGAQAATSSPMRVGAAVSPGRQRIINVVMPNSAKTASTTGGGGFGTVLSTAGMHSSASASLNASAAPSQGGAQLGVVGPSSMSVSVNSAGGHSRGSSRPTSRASSFTHPSALLPATATAAAAFKEEETDMKQGGEGSKQSQSRRKPRFDIGPWVNNFCGAGPGGKPASADMNRSITRSNENKPDIADAAAAPMTASREADKKPSSSEFGQELADFVEFFCETALTESGCSLLNPSLYGGNSSCPRQLFLMQLRRSLRLGKPAEETTEGGEVGETDEEALLRVSAAGVDAAAQRAAATAVSSSGAVDNKGEAESDNVASKLGSEAVDCESREGEEEEDPLDDGSYHQQNVAYVLDTFGAAMDAKSKFGLVDLRQGGKTQGERKQKFEAACKVLPPATAALQLLFHVSSSVAIGTGGGKSSK